MKENKLVNSLKLSIAVIVATALAYAFELDYPVSAGIVAILAILRTKRETIKTAAARALAFLAALLIAAVCFGVFGITVGAYGLFFVVYIFVAGAMNWTFAVSSNAVLVSHFLSSGRFDSEAILNEIALFVIGVGVGILLNLHLRKNVHHFEKMKQETDAYIVTIISRMAERVNNHDISDYNGTCFHELDRLLFETKHVAEYNYNNQFNKYDVYDLEYIDMREKQCVVLFEMYNLIRHLETTPSTAAKISEFLDVLSHVLDEKNDGVELMERFREMDQFMKNHPLPQERQEFEDRARLFCFMRDMEQFIQIKMDFMKEHGRSEV